jgi:hypothetical protein
VNIIRSGLHRPAANTSLFLRTFASPTSKSGSDHHSFFQQQLEELESERTSLFGVEEEEDANKRQSDDLLQLAGANKTGQEQHAFFEEELVELNVQQQTTTAAEENITQEEDWEDRQQEREALFQFSKEEKQAWGSQQQVLSSQLLQEIALARQEQANPKEVLQPPPVPSIVETTTLHHSSFTHVSQDGTSVHMVDVGHKEVTTRTAQAQTKVLLPDEVLEAFASSSNGEELVGKKGPIFSTAKLAGIMAAK